MAQIRQLIGHLSPEGLAEATFSNRLERIVRDFRELTGTSVDLTLAGDPAALTPVAADVLQKTLQEALVNIAKHARAQGACVRIEIGDGWTSVEVSDDGVGLSAGRGMRSASQFPTPDTTSISTDSEVTAWPRFASSSSMTTRLCVTVCGFRSSSSPTWR